MLGHTDDVDSVAVSPDGHCLLFDSADNTIRHWGRPVFSNQQQLAQRLAQQAKMAWDKNPLQQHRPDYQTLTTAEAVIRRSVKAYGKPIPTSNTQQPFEAKVIESSVAV